MPSLGLGPDEFVPLTTLTVKAVKAKANLHGDGADRLRSRGLLFALHLTCESRSFVSPFTRQSAKPCSEERCTRYQKNWLASQGRLELARS